MEPESPGTISWMSDLILTEKVGATPTRIGTEGVVSSANAHPLFDRTFRSYRRFRGGGMATIHFGRITAHLRIIVEKEVVLATSRKCAIITAQKVTSTRRGVTHKPIVVYTLT